MVDSMVGWVSKKAPYWHTYILYILWRIAAECKMLVSRPVVEMSEKSAQKRLEKFAHLNKMSLLCTRFDEENASLISKSS